MLLEKIPLQSNIGGCGNKSVDIPASKFEQETAILQMMEIFYDDPVLFAQVVLNVFPDRQQRRVLRAAYKKQRTSVRSGRGCGKTWVAAILIWHFLCTRPHAQVYCTAPSAVSALGALWPTVKNVHNLMEPLWKDLFEVQNNTIKNIEHPLTWFCSVRVARQENPEAMAGAHAPHMMYIVDEASGVTDAIISIISNSLTEDDNRLILLSNPRRLSGAFYESQQRHKRDLYTQLHLSCYESEFITEDKLNSMIVEANGEGTDAHMIEVMGEFPKKEDKCIIDGFLIEAALDRDLPEEDFKDVPVIWGVDMATSNDMSVLVKRQGNRVLNDIKRWKLRDTMKVVAKIHEEYINTPDGLKPVRINVDSIGIGKGAYDRLKELIGATIVYSAVANKKPFSKKYMYNQKSEWWAEMREWFRDEVEIPEDKPLIDEITAMHSTPSGDGRFRTEAKADYIKRFSHSPDTGDAFAMTFVKTGKKCAGITT